MLLSHCRIPGQDGYVDLSVRGDRIYSVEPWAGSSVVHSQVKISFNQSLVFPGLINSHDHLDFNLFKTWGSEVFDNYRDWSRHLNQHYRKEIDQILAIPQSLRIRWGIYKNLLNGFTTVVNHGQPLVIEEPLIRVLQPEFLHSVGFEKNWKWKILRPRRRRQPMVVHVGEGTDARAHAEIDELVKRNLFRRQLVAVHGVAMEERQASAFRSLVWCPASNYHMLRKTAAIKKLQTHVPIVFGTDSTLTAGWNAWSQLRMARYSGEATDDSLFNMTTAVPARVWNLPGLGTLKAGSPADLVVARSSSGKSGWDAFFSLNPADIQLVMQAGEPRLFDADLLEPLQRAGFRMGNYSRIEMATQTKYVQGELSSLMKQIGDQVPGLTWPFTLLSS